MFRRFAVALSIGLLILGTGCKSGPNAASTVDTIYYGDIVAVNDAQPAAEAIAIKNGRILMVGSLAAIEENHKGSSTMMVITQGRQGFVQR